MAWGRPRSAVWWSRQGRAGRLGWSRRAARWRATGAHSVRRASNLLPDERVQRRTRPAPGRFPTPAPVSVLVELDLQAAGRVVEHLDRDAVTRELHALVRHLGV